MKAIKVKRWVFDKAQREAHAYGMTIDIKYLDEIPEDASAVEQIDGMVTLYGEQIAESDKAIKVRLMTGMAGGSAKGWIIWIPKSALA